jgi:ATP/ADP translocase
MSQGFTFWGYVKTAGIVPCLFTMGVVLHWLKIITWFGDFLVVVSGLFATSYAFMGLLGILKNNEVLEIKKITIDFGDIFKKKKKEDSIIEQK